MKITCTVCGKEEKLSNDMIIFEIKPFIYPEGSASFDIVCLACGHKVECILL